VHPPKRTNAERVLTLYVCESQMQFHGGSFVVWREVPSLAELTQLLTGGNSGSPNSAFPPSLHGGDRLRMGRASKPWVA
jgi:hypothetical protein